MISQTEQDDSFSTANPTGLIAGGSGLKVAYGNSADGDYGYPGNGSGDFDFFKLSANVGQVILVDLKNNGNNADFDGYVAIYRADGSVAKENDDVGDGNRASSATFTADVAGDYYVVVSNWIAGENVSSLPADPTTPGTGGGLPGGTGGPYKVIIGLDANAPILQLDSLVSTNPVPFPYWSRTIGSLSYTKTAPFKITNTGTAPYNLTSFAITGTNAAKFSVQGLTTPLTLNVGQSANFTLTYLGDGVLPQANALLDFSSNDPLNIDLPLIAFDNVVTGGGKFTVRQVYGGTGVTVNSLAVADSLLAGTNAGASATELKPVINYYRSGNRGYFDGDSAFPIVGGSGDNFATQATGNFFARQDGFYTFRGYSDDGQRLRVDGIPVIESEAANTATYGSIELTAGVHTIEFTHREGGGDDGTELCVAQVLGQFTEDNDSTWELVEAYSDDSDGDGLPTVWETAHGLDPNSALGVNGAAGDPDADSSPNSSEFARGTDPQVADTDGDGLKDGFETDTTFWMSVTDTGTDPLVADSDFDGLSDGVENPTLASTGASQPGTDPNKLDTDGDGYADLSEITIGTNPKVAGSNPAFNYQAFLSDNFDGTAVASTYAFSKSGPAASFTPAVTASGVGANAQAAQLTSTTASNNNSIAWNQVTATAPQAIRLTFDFRISNETNPADGIGIGLFRTGTWGSAGSSNPGTGKNWENPTEAGGFPQALSFGFAVFGTDFIRMTGPTVAGSPLAQVAAPFSLSNGLFNRVIITGVTNGPGGTMFSMEIIEDVNGVGTHRPIFSNVLVPGFTVATEQLRLIAGARTGGANARMDLDNVSLSVPGQSLTISIKKQAGQVIVDFTGVLQSSPDLGTFTDVPGAVSPYTVPAGSPSKLFYRPR